MPYIVEINSSYHPGPNWSTFHGVDPASLEYVPDVAFLDQSYGLKGLAEDISVFYHAYRAQFDHILDDAAHEHFMFAGNVPIVSEEFRQMIERIEPDHHQFKQVRLYDYWGKPFEGTAFYIMNVIGMIKNANMDMAMHYQPFQLYPDQEFGHLMRFESRSSKYFASDVLANAWNALCGPKHRMEFHWMSEASTRL
jgi:hypothetical protein